MRSMSDERKIFYKTFGLLLAKVIVGSVSSLIDVLYDRSSSRQEHQTRGRQNMMNALKAITAVAGIFWPGSPNWPSSYVSPGTRLQDRSFSVRLSQYADLLFRHPEFAFHSSDSFG